MKNKKIAVVGVGGVGMAHICAAVRCGYTVSHIVDKNPIILSSAIELWRNSWGDFSEEVKVNPDCIYSQRYDSLYGKDYDLIIIATPPSTHYQILRDLLYNTKSKILLEKPFFYDPTADIEKVYCGFYNLISAFYDRVYLSCEWINHSTLKNDLIFHASYSRIPELMEFSFPYSHNTQWESNLPTILDFISHAVSILYFAGYDPYTISSYDRLTMDDFSVDILLQNTKKIKFIGNRVGEHISLEFDGKRLYYNWIPDLFDRQILSIIEDITLPSPEFLKRNLVIEYQVSKKMSSILI